MNKNELKIVVISDLHCRYKQNDNENHTTLLYSNLLREPSTKHPVQNLIELTSRESIQADLLLCPGDITDKIDLQGYITGWSFLEELQIAFNAKNLYATLGNHDVDSRGIHSGNSFAFAKGIKSNYPVNDLTAKNQFWSDGFCIITTDEYRLLIFNSAHSFTSLSESQNTKITDSILAKMRQQLINTSGRRFNFAMCHHHPMQHANPDYKDGDVIDKGDKFLDLLEEYQFQLFLHGHKHEPRLRYYNSLPVFCAGSFSSRENVDEIKADNVFHLVTLLANSTDGKIESWIWQPRLGWTKKLGAFFPINTGFGYRGNIRTLSDKIDNWLTQKDNISQKYNTLVQDIPEILYLIPTEQTQLNEILLMNHHIEFTPALPHIPHYISRQVQ